MSNYIAPKDDYSESDDLGIDKWSKLAADELLRLNEADERVRQVTDEINSALKKFAVPITVDANGHIAPGIVEGLISKIDEEYPGISEEQAYKLSYIKFTKKASEEIALYGKIGIMKSFAEDPQANRDIADEKYFDKQKREIIGSWIRDRDLDIDTDTPWLKFLNHVLPGRELTNEDVRLAVIDIIDQQPALQEKQMYNQLAHLVASEKSGLDNHLNNNPTIQMDLLMLYYEVQLDSDTEHRKFAIEGLARSYGLPTTVVDTYLAVLDANLPGQNTENK